jgi:Co/Zn/Cd efflux system component
VLVLQALAQQLEARERAVQAEAVAQVLVGVALAAVLVLALVAVVVVVDHHHHRQSHRHRHRYLEAICGACGLLHMWESYMIINDTIMQCVEGSLVIEGTHAHSTFRARTLVQ